MAEHSIGTIVHINIPSLDLAESQAFYSKLFGWRFTPGGADYLFFDDGGIGGGFTFSSKPAPDSGILFYVRVADIPSKLAEAATAGGKVLVEKTPIGEHGFYAVFADPQGNRVGLNSKQ